MNNVTIGNVTRIDRANRILYAHFDDYAEGEESQHAYIHEPIPVAPAAFAPINGELVCVDTVAQPELLVDDHFTQSDVGPWEGDSPWDITGGTSIDVASAGLGVTQVQNNAGVEGMLRKGLDTILVEADRMYHIATRMRVESIGASGQQQFAVVGFYTDTFAFTGAIINNAAAGVWGLLGAAVEGLEIVAGAWYHVDVVYLPGPDWIAASFDGSVFALAFAHGSGGYSAITPLLYIACITLGCVTQYQLRVDRYRLSTCPAPVDARQTLLVGV